MQTQAISILILNIVFFLVILILIYRILRFVIRLIRKTFERYEVDIPAILIGLGISLMFFIYTIGYFLQDLVRFTVQFISFPFTLLNRFTPKDDGDFIYIADKMFREIQDLIIKFFSNLDLTNLFFFLISWSLISLYATKITVGNKNTSNEDLQILRKNFISICVLLFAAYLSMTAIIAIPVVNYKSELKKEAILTNFKNDLERNPIDFNTLYLDSALLDKYSTIDADKTKQIRKYNSIKENYIITISQSERQIEKQKLFAEMKLEEVFSRKVKDQTILQYKTSLTIWYFNYKEDVIRNLDKIKYRLLTSESDQPSISSSDSYENVLEYLQNFYNEISVDRLRDSPPPNVPKPGDNFGIFGIVAGWLINLEDIAFVLIIGLIGFGLLGAAGSELIKKLNVLELNKLLISNLNGAIVRGTTAALVVFLAVKGGMAILTTSETENINPYALFFICFISSVYSSDVWEWAKMKLLEKMKTTTEIQKIINADNPMK